MDRQGSNGTVISLAMVAPFGSFVGHGERALLQAADQPPGPLGSGVCRGQPQRQDLADRTPGVEIGAGGHVRGDARPPLVHRAGPFAQHPQRLVPGQVLDQADRRAQHVEARLTVGEGLAQEDEVFLLAFARQLVFDPRRARGLEGTLRRWPAGPGRPCS